MPTAYALASRLGFLAATLLALPAIAFAAPLAVLAVSWRGRIFAFGLLGAAVGLLGLPLTLRRPHARRWRRRVLALLVLAGAAAIACVPLTGPIGTGGDDQLRIEHLSMRTGTAGAFAPSGLWIPEADLVSLGIGLAPFLDPQIDRRQAQRIRALVMPKYEAIESDPALCDLGSALAGSFREVAGIAFDDGHGLAIVPRHGGAAGSRAALVFLHGSGGNFAVYWQALLPLAREHGIALLFPTFGAGNWSRPGGVEAVLEARSLACERYSVDPGQVFLAVLSNGGRGAMRLLAREPQAFRGVALISAVVEEKVVDTVRGTGRLDGLPIYFAHGDADDRVPLAAVEPAVRKLEAAGAAVTRRIFAGEDHFLLFSRLDEVLADLLEWMQSSSPASAGGQRH